MDTFWTWGRYPAAPPKKDDAVYFIYVLMLSYFITLLSAAMLGDWIGDDKMMLDEYLIIVTIVSVVLILNKIRLSLMGLK